MTSTAAGSASGAPSQPNGPGRSATIALGLVAVLLVAGGWFLPLWQATLYAPQYPGGLTTIAYGNDVVGDLNEINALNHYVGLGVFDPADVPEMALWPLALAGAVVAVAVALLGRRRWLTRLGSLYLWALPVGVLAATQFRLHQFGQDVTPGAAFHLDPFTPWVVGKTTVWNFETWAWPGLGLVALVLAAALVTFGPGLLARMTTTAATARTVGVAALAAVLLIGGSVGTTAGPAHADVHDHAGHDHADHGHAEDGRTRQPAERDDVGGAPPAPDVGPTSHATMPAVVDHPVVGDLADLLEATGPGGTLRLEAGTYSGPVVIDQPVTIEGEGLPIVQGDGTGSVITVRAPGTVIRGLAVRGSGGGPTDDPAGIRIEADDVTIDGVVVEHSYVGIAVDSVAAVKLTDNHIHGRMGAAIVDEGHAVADDVDANADADDHAHDDAHAHDGAHAHDDAHGDAHGDAHAHGGHAPASGPAPGATGARGDGIWLHDVDHALIRGNHIEHVRDGIYVSFGSGALVDGNHVHHSRYAVHSMFARDLSLVQNHFIDNLSGVVLMYGGDVLLLRNHIEGNTSPSTGFGIILKDVLDVEAVQNVLVGNRVGLHLDGPSETASAASFLANTVARNTVGVQLLSSTRASFSANSFAANDIQALSLGGRLRDVAWAAEGWGNYWSTYRGYDALGQGRGAVAHSEGGSVDRLLGRNPELIAIASSPAMRLLRSVEERWGQRDPVVVDELPLTQPMSPALVAPAPEPPARALGSVLGALLVVPALVMFFRRPRRATAPSRRSLRAVSV